MATCPKGHDSGTLDYCDVCGALMGGAAAAPAANSAAPPPAAAPAAAASSAAPPAAAASAPAPSPAAASPEVKSCPVCGTPQTGRFCEEDGYDFLLAPPVTMAPATREAPPASGPASSGPPASGPAPSGLAPSAPASRGWAVVVSADSAYFEAVKAMGGEDAGGLTFPRFAPERRFALTGEQMVIGRRSRSRGVDPDIDLVGPPEDPGVSHLHALLVAAPDGWAVVDLESANGTYLNDPSTNPIDPNVPVSVKDGDKIYLGAWTALTIHAA